MENLKLFETDGTSRATRRLAVKLALRGKQLSGYQFYDDAKPYCDEPVQIKRATRAGGYQGHIQKTDTGQTFTGRMAFKNPKGLEVSFWAPCRKCDKCLLFRQLKWRERALVEINRAKRSWFVTLTFSPVHITGIQFEANLLSERYTPDQRFDRAAYGHVQKYLKRLRKAAPRAGLRFLGVFEKGEKTGRPHYHLLLHETGDRPISKRTIEHHWRSNVHCRLVASDKGAATYLTKYATKSFDIRPRASVGYGKPLFSSDERR